MKRGKQTKTRKKRVSQNIHFIFTKDVKTGLKKKVRNQIAVILSSETVCIKETRFREIGDKDADFLINAGTADYAGLLIKKTYIRKNSGECIPLKMILSDSIAEEIIQVLEQSDIYKNCPKEEQKLYKHKISCELVPGILYSAAGIPASLALECLGKNPHYSGMKCIQKYASVLKCMPEDITLLFPQARKIKRHFILHVGDTNTGKTYDAVQDCMSAEHGVFLAPLRLLAMETQEKMNHAGIPCSLLTGEEEDFVEGATHISSTVEMLDTETRYDVCVIDEAQMISDRYRGWAWTKAVLGVCAQRVHVCMSENAENLVIELIRKCGDTFELVKHKRSVPLVFDESLFTFPSSVREKDALIVFSRQKVLSVAAELRSLNIKTSVIYGALPYSVRKNEIQRFIKGETSVIVSTDAIGMGMNLPVRRIVFMESSKYDGIENRLLTGPEVKQIAGRAGRRGMFDTGYVNSVIDKQYLKEQFYKKYKPLKRARVRIPESLLSLNMPLSEIIRQWSVIVNEDIYEKEDTDLILEKCIFLEDLKKEGFELSKQMMWRFMIIPFDEKNQILTELWKTLVIYSVTGTDIDTDMESQFCPNDSLESMEINYKILDLYFSFSRAVHYNKNEFRRNIMEQKNELAVKIMKELEKKQVQGRKCPGCNTPLPWNYPYRLCQSCYKQNRT